MISWLHRLFNPHCEHCQEQDELLNHCETCEVLKMELASVKQERNMLLSNILNPKQEATPEKAEDPDEPLKSLRPVHVPWRVKQQHMEAESRATARILAQREKEAQSKDSANTKLRAADVSKPLTVEEMESVIVGETDAVSGSNA